MPSRAIAIASLINAAIAWRIILQRAALHVVRDLTKDPLDNESPNLLLSYSSDLVNWRNLGPRNRGRPLQYAEGGAEEGNAVSPFIRRSLLLSPVPLKSFFRLIAE